MTEPRKTDAEKEVRAEGFLPAQPLRFIPIEDYTTYRAEFAVTDGDLVFHFYKTPEVSQRPSTYWMETFPTALQQACDKHFEVSFPRLKAAFTEEQDSWWLRAYGFGHLLDPHRYAYGFFDLLDKTLDSLIST